MACSSCPSLALSSSLRLGLARPAGTREEGEAGRNGRDRSTWGTGEQTKEPRPLMNLPATKPMPEWTKRPTRGTRVDLARVMEKR